MQIIIPSLPRFLMYIARGDFLACHIRDLAAFVNKSDHGFRLECYAWDG